MTQNNSPEPTSTDVGSAVPTSINNNPDLKDKVRLLEEEIHGLPEKGYKGLKDRVTDLETGLTSKIFLQLKRISLANYVAIIGWMLVIIWNIYLNFYS